MNNTANQQINIEKSNIHIKEEAKTSIAEKRTELKGLSKGIQMLVKEGAYDTVNEGLKELYRSEGHTELKTFNQWKKDGFFVNKGEHALLLWGRPKEVTREQDANKAEEPDEHADFYPICFVFSNKQVTKGGQKNDRK